MHGLNEAIVEILEDVIPKARKTARQQSVSDVSLKAIEERGEVFKRSRHHGRAIAKCHAEAALRGPGGAALAPARVHGRRLQPKRLHEMTVEELYKRALEHRDEKEAMDKMLEAYRVAVKE